MLESRMLGNQHVRFGWGQSEKEQLMIPLGIQPSGSKNYRNLAGCLPNLSERKDASQQYHRTVLLQGPDRTVAATMGTGFQVKPMSFYGQKRDLVDIKEERPEYQEMASPVLQDVLQRLDKAFSAFFRRIRHGETAGYPRFKGRNRYNSFTSPDGAGWKFDGMILHLCKIGRAKVKLHRPLPGLMKTVTLLSEVAHWDVTLSCEVEPY